MLPDRQRLLYSSDFQFSDEGVSLVSYVPKGTKAVVLLSMQHWDAKVDSDEKAKPEIIQYYNTTKSGVDVLDKLIQTYSCKRPSRRWTVCFFWNLLDIAAYNLLVLWITEHPSWNSGKSHMRRLFLRELGTELVGGHASSRLQQPHGKRRRIQDSAYQYRIYIQLILLCVLKHGPWPKLWKIGLLPLTTLGTIFTNNASLLCSLCHFDGTTTHQLCFIFVFLCFCSHCNGSVFICIFLFCGGLSIFSRALCWVVLLSRVSTSVFRKLWIFLRGFFCCFCCASPLPGRVGSQQDVGHGSHVVLDLSTSIANTGRNITTDNFFTSYRLTQQLMQRSLSLAGTIRRNRKKIPPSMQLDRSRPACSSVFGFMMHKHKIRLATSPLFRSKTYATANVDAVW